MTLHAKKQLGSHLTGGFFFFNRDFSLLWLLKTVNYWGKNSFYLSFSPNSLIITKYLMLESDILQ